MLFRVHLSHYENLITHHPHHRTPLTNHFHHLYLYSGSLQNKIKFLKEENRGLSDKMVLVREKKSQQSDEIEILEDKVGQLKQTSKEMKQKIGNLQHQQDNQTNLIIQQIEIQREMQSDSQQLLHSYDGKKAGGQMVISN